MKYRSQERKLHNKLEKLRNTPYERHEMKPNQLKELHAVVKEFSTEEILVIAIPGQLTNSGKLVNAIEVTVQHKPTKKSQGFIYRGETSNFRSALKEAVDILVNEIHREALTEPKKKKGL